MMKQQLLKKKNRNDEVSDPTEGSQAAAVVDELQARIAHRAYELFEHEGCCHGHDLVHWLQAEREMIRGEPEK
jgi:hypothetical protein